MRSGIWAAVSIGSGAVEEVVQLLDPEKSVKELGVLIHEDLASCSRVCSDILYTCVEREQQDGFLCTMDTTMLLIVVIAAVLTGVLIPIVCVTVCMCTRFCGIFDDSHTETQGLIHSDLRQDWDTYPSSDFPQQINNQDELMECSTGIMPLLSNNSDNHKIPPLTLDDNPYKETVISTIEA